jgi:hypothetical protein
MWVRVLSGEVLRRLEELEDKARELNLEFIFDGEVLLRDKKTDKIYYMLDIEASAEDHDRNDYIGDFPMTLDFKLCREEL